MNFRQKSGAVRCALMLLFAPFFLSALVPAGVMPGISNGAPTMVICSAMGMVEMAVDPLTGAPVEKAPEAGKRCDWNSARSADALLPPLPVIAPAALALRAGAPNPSAILVAASATGLPPATGPPAAV